MGKLYKMGKAPVFLEDGGLYMTSDFGYRVDPVTGIGNQAHKGFDCVKWDGYMNVATIVAFEDGEVTGVCDNVPGQDTNNPNNSAGNYVCIKHTNGYKTKYFHLKHDSIPADIYVGAKVRKGQVIGFMGSTGNSTGTHLHFQLELNNVPIDPKPYLIDGKRFAEESDLDNIEMENEDMDVNRFEELWFEMRKELQDNDASDWSAEARNWAVGTGLIIGGGDMPDGNVNYMWNDLLTREQMAVVLYRFAKLVGAV